MVIMLAWDAAKTSASYELVKEHPNSICIQKVLVNEVLVEGQRQHCHLGLYHCDS